MAKTLQSYLKDSPEIISKITEHAYSCNKSNAEVLRIVLREQIKKFYTSIGKEVVTWNLDDSQIIAELGEIGKREDRKIASVLRVLLGVWMVEHENNNR